MGSIDADVVAYVPEPASAPLVAESSSADEARLRQLSKRERQVLAHFVEGRSTKSVAKILGISPRTIETYSVLIVQKLRARNRIHAVAIALRTGILTQQDR